MTTGDDLNTPLNESLNTTSKDNANEMIIDKMDWTQAAVKEDLDIQQLFELYDKMFNITDHAVNITENFYNMNYTKNTSTKNKTFDLNEKYFVNVSNSFYEDANMNLSSLNDDYPNYIIDLKFRQTSNEILDLSTAENQTSDFVIRNEINLLNEPLNITQIPSNYNQRQWEQHLEAKIGSIIFNESFSENDNVTDDDMTNESNEIALVHEFESLNMLKFNESTPLVSFFFKLFDCFYIYIIVFILS